MTYSDLKQKVKEYLSDDWMGLWVFCTMFASAGFALEERKTLVLQSIKKLLDDKVMVAGNLLENNNFVPWVMSSDEVVRILDEKWSLLEAEPNISDDIAWFASADYLNQTK